MFVITDGAPVSVSMYTYEQRHVVALGTVHSQYVAPLASELKSKANVGFSVLWGWITSDDSSITPPPRLKSFTTAVPETEDPLVTRHRANPWETFGELNGEVRSVTAALAAVCPMRT